MHRVVSPEDVKKLGTILSVWAHPDDESFSCAGIMKIAIDNGQTVACITATKGEAGIQDETRWPADQLADIRTKEMAKTLSILGVTNHHWLDYGDGHCSQVNVQEAAVRVAELIRLYQPDTVLTFGPDGMTGHSDHQSVSRWVSEAVKLVDNKPTVYHAVHLNETYEKYMRQADEQFNIFFNIDKPPLVEPGQCDIYVHLPEDVCRVKCQALAAQHSQTEGLLTIFGEDNLLNVFADETFVLAKHKP